MGYYRIESLNNLISNFGTIENTIKPILDISYTTFVLQKQIIENLKEKQKFLLAQVCYNYNNSILLVTDFILNQEYTKTNS